MEIFEQLPEEVDHIIDGLISHDVVGNDVVGLTQYSIWMFIAIVVLGILVYVTVKKEALVPKGRFINGMEALFEFVRSNIIDGAIGGPSARKHLPFIMSLFFFILVNNLIGVIPGCKPGTGTIGVTFALAIVSFIYFIVYGIKAHGAFGYVKSLMPSGVMFPVNILVWVIEVFSTILRLFTLAIRLFANLFAGHIILGVFATLVSMFLLPAITDFTVGHLIGASSSIIWMLLLTFIYMIEITVALIQTYVFVILSAVYVQIATSDEH